MDSAGGVCEHERFFGGTFAGYLMDIRELE